MLILQAEMADSHDRDSHINTFKTMKTDVHIGKMIEKKLRERGCQVTWFANELCTERTNIYKIFRRRSIDTELLMKISRILEYDFFSYYSRELTAQKLEQGQVSEQVSEQVSTYGTSASK